MTGEVSKSKLFLARLVVVLMVAFVVLGLALYGFSAEVRARIWQNLFDRPGGPMTFRFFLQPTMATIAALSRWRQGRPDRARSLFLDDPHRPGEARVRLQRGPDRHRAHHPAGPRAWTLIYQFIEFDTFHPAEAVIIALAARLRALPAAAWARSRVSRAGGSAADLRATIR